MTWIVVAWFAGAVLHQAATWIEWSRPRQRDPRLYLAVNFKPVGGAVIADLIGVALYLGGYLGPMLDAALGAIGMGFGGELPIAVAPALLFGYLFDSTGKKALGAFVNTKRDPRGSDALVDG